MAESAQASYDLFVSYAEADQTWVKGYLLDALKAAGVHTHSEEAFRLGAPRLLEFEQAVKDSQRTLLVLTPAYLAKGWNEFFRLMAQSYDLDQEAWRVIPLRLEPVALPPGLAMLQPLDATDPAQRDRALERLCADLQRPVPAPAPPPARPYPGMRPFSEEEKDCFFGRDAKVAPMVNALRKHPFLAVIGPSGSGKSSLVFAGLVPKLRESGLFGGGSWQVISLRPGKTPTESLADTIKGDVNQPAKAISDLLSSQPGTRRLLLVVDQFEELFTQAEEGEVKPFQEALLRLIETPDCYVVLTVRADFYDDLMTSLLWRQIERHRAEVLPLDEEGLRQAIVRPAERRGVFVNPFLVERLVSDAAGQPGLLPFVQETLVLLWEKLERHYLPLSAYDEMSDLRAAMAQHADKVLDTLTPEEEAIARRILLRLVQFGEGRAHTRRQQPVAALRAAGDDSREFDATLENLARGRLLTLGGEEEKEDRSVDIAHEALIVGWPSLRTWVAKRREAEQTRRRLEDKAQEWVRLGRGKGGLLVEVALAEAERWLDSADAAELGKSAELIALVEASRTELRTQRRLRSIGMASAALVVLALVVILAFLGYREWLRRYSIPTDLVPIDGGTAIIGRDDRSVTLLPFQIERYEVSVARYRACVNVWVCDPPETPDWAGGNEEWYKDERWDDLPIVQVSARQAHAYCTWLGRRLPTVVEWERAARGPDGRLWPWGDDSKPPAGCDSDKRVVLVDSYKETATVLPEEGIYHLADNVTEWVAVVPMPCEGTACHQAWDPDSDESSGLEIGLIGGSCDRHIDRVAELAAGTYGPDSPGQIRGFRCAADSAP